MSGGKNWRKNLNKTMATFILGAGFSRYAELPLGDELFSEVLSLAELYRLDNVIERDIKVFLNYQRNAKGARLRKEDINFEKFISFLDIEHYLRLKGKDNWSNDGNESQMIMRNLISLVLYNRQRKISTKQLALYENFASRLGPNDWIFSFNYDTILEQALTKKNIPYRLFPYRNKLYDDDIIASDDKDEIVLLKLHGSIDWFDSANTKKYIDDSKKNFGIDVKPFNIVFKDPDKFGTHKLINDPYADDSPLDSIYIVKNLDKYFQERNFLSQHPLIVSPSYNKLLYLNPLREFWRGFNRIGSLENRVVVIGFSLPSHDEYIRQPLYHLINNFQCFQDNTGLTKKVNLKMIDYKKTEVDVKKYKKTYRFVDSRKTDYYFDGFNPKALRVIFKNK
jgi:hypothetical protein